MIPTLPGQVPDTFRKALRGVRVVRLSVLTDETTSPERQREADDIAAEALNIDFGEGDNLREAVDLDVSASKVSPFDRPELGKWMARPEAFDVLVWWRFDRAIRSMADMHDLAKWAKEHRKMLVFAEGIGGGRLEFDFRNPMSPMAELMMMMLAFAAQVESQSISDRVLGAQAAMRKMPLRWAGSRPPYGYMPAPMPKEHGGVGKTLVIDPAAVRVIERIIRELLAGKAASAIAVGLNADGIPSPRDHWALRNKRKTGGKTGGKRGGIVRKVFKWTSTVITSLLRSPAMLGWKMHQGKPVRDAAGNPVLMSEAAIMERAEYDRVCKILDDRSIVRTERSDTDSLLKGVIHCADCGMRMYLQRQKSKPNTAPVYRCSARARGVKCATRPHIRADWVDEFVTDEFLRLAGGIKVRTVVEIPGYDPEPEIAATLAEFKEHQEQKGRQKSRAGLAAWQERADALDNRLAELESREKIEPRREVTTTDRTYADEWNDADASGRRAMLVDAGARLDVRRGTPGGWRTLDPRRVDFDMTGELDPAVEARQALAEDVIERPQVPALAA
ncbi:recombinase family protein [Streptomyces sp. NPDC001404]|uniref:recombinase family protein n=1 Tax=Streptomyces sp. NPDC001404 TaxID=3364571 RepID=UPI0036CD9B80